jgi:hypothetical protein
VAILKKKPSMTLCLCEFSAVETFTRHGAFVRWLLHRARVVCSEGVYSPETMLSFRSRSVWCIAIAEMLPSCHPKYFCIYSGKEKHQGLMHVQLNCFALVRDLMVALRDATLA